MNKHVVFTIITLLMIFVVPKLISLPSNVALGFGLMLTIFYFYLIKLYADNDFTIKRIKSDFKKIFKNAN